LIKIKCRKKRGWTRLGQNKTQEERDKRDLIKINRRKRGINETWSK
jgi:hypothetical protein